MFRDTNTELELRSKLWVKFCESIWADFKKNLCVRDSGEIGCDALVYMPELKR